MTEVISVKFKSMGKTYFFAPNGNTVATGDSVVIETAKGLEMAECVYGNHMVEDTSVVQPLRPVIRIATESDLRVAEINKEKEKEAYDICKQKISEHGLEMKLVDVECNFEGIKTTFFFTADGRVDFRDLVKDLAGIFRNRIELRQIGVRDETKMLGGLGICGRPYCCNQFVDEFQPVSTKMAKIQNMSLNPTKISGSCGRLMCCLRYEQEAYEELISNVPKQGTFVETPTGYGVVSQVNLLRQTVKVTLDGEGDDVIKTYEADEIAVVPGGRPANGETPPHVLKIKPKKKKTEQEADDWLAPVLFAEDMTGETAEEKNPEKSGASGGKKRRRNRRPKKKSGNAPEKKVSANAQETAKKQENKANAPKGGAKTAPKAENGSAEKTGDKAKAKKRRRPNRRKPKKKTPAGE